jgi:membrane protein
MSVSDVIPLVKETFSEWSADKASRLAAALAYYTVFSLAPLLIIVIAIASVVFANAQQQLLEQVQQLVGAEGAEQVRTMIEQTSQPSASIPATIIGVVTLLLGASGVFGQLQDSLNTIWEVQPKPGRGILAVVKDRFLSFSMVLGIGFLLLVSLVVSTALSALTTVVGEELGIAAAAGQVANIVISFAVTTLLFAMIYKVLPDVEIDWSDVWIGAAVTALLFTLGRFLIGLYLGRSAVGSAYGAAGSLVVILLWIYYSAQILFLGAEFTQVYARRHGSRIMPAANAIRMTQAARINQGMPKRKNLAGSDTSGSEEGRPQTREGVPALPAKPPTRYGNVRRLAGSWGPVAAGLALGLVTAFFEGDRDPRRPAKRSEERDR